MEYWLAAHWDGRKGIAASLRPAIGKSGPGPVMDLPWRELLRLSGFTWDPADPVADKAMQVRYRRAVERMRKAGYIVSAGPLAEAQAGDSVEIIGIQRATRARPAGLRIRASARFVAAQPVRGQEAQVRAQGRGLVRGLAALTGLRAVQQSRADRSRIIAGGMLAEQRQHSA